MNLRKAFTAVAASAGVCSVVGGLVGYLIGLLAPSAYRGLILWRDPSEFSPTEFGAGLGFAQGLLVGAVLGIVVVALVTWYEVRTSEKTAKDGASGKGE